ncbi:MAG: AMP-binding protein [Clostridia bacterium]|nr:AMP-binding protein [Clostridia bacterium]MBR2973976.1 AMP-binding protein [Clostridia bacterium]
MKIVFSTKNVSRASFLDTCRYAFDYGFEGFEIYDAIKERSSHHDSILRRDRISDAKRKLVNRNLSVSALRMPESIDSENTTAELIAKYVDMACASAIPSIIVSINEKVDYDVLDEKLSLAVKRAEISDVNILLETVGYLSNTENVIDVINHFSSAAIGASWNVRGTYFAAGETAETTIKTLGAYIKYVRLGDMKDGKTVLIGEGELEVEKLINALSSLNYEGYICAAWNEEINDADIVLTHFANYIASLNRDKKTYDRAYYNRDKTGTFAWKKYDVIEATFSDVLDTMVENYPDQYAFKYPTLDYTRTYEEFRRDVDECAAALISLGVKAGDHVAVWATNVPEWFITFWATTKIGAVLVTVNTAYKIHEIEYLLKQSDTHTLVMIEFCKDINYKEIIGELCPELDNLEPGKPLYSKKLPFLRNVVTVGFSMQGCLTWEEMLNRSALVPREEVRRRASLVRPDDVCNMQYTSGTTGFPKGVMLTHRNIVNNGKTIGDRMDLSTADRMMIQVPMFHCFGMVLSMTSTMTHGGTLCPIPYFSPKSSLACVNDEKITCFNGVPTMFIAMFNHADFSKTDFSHMRTGIMAGANCPADLMRRASVEMNMREIISVYGQTEASPGCTMGEVNEDLDHRVETVGSAFPGVECKIIDPETGEELPDGESGEFVARGFNIMKGYYKMPEATAQAIDSEGWLHSGDICMRTSDGYYKVTGRLKDMIIRGGENLYPREIEEFYLTNPKVRDVQVVGVPDERYGEECCAWIILHKGEASDENEMREFGNSYIARHKVPRYFMFVDEFPMNAAGKILKYKMRDISAEKLGLKK